MNEVKESSESLIADADYSSIIEKYFEKYADFFPNDGAKAVFLVGTLVGFLLEVQRIQNPNRQTIEPFWRTLHGLNVDQRLIKQIFVKAIDKLKLYGFSYSSLISVVSDYVKKAGSNFGLDKLEMSWFFAHGLASYVQLRRESNSSSNSNNKSKKKVGD